MNKYETPQQAAKRLSACLLEQGYEMIALHPYQNAQGQNIYWRIRLKNSRTNEKWIRPMHLTYANEFQLKEPHFHEEKLLYNLPQINQHPEERIWLTEGELCADKLIELGCIATTSGSVDSVYGTDWSPLAKRSVIIWRDNDEAGLRYANDVTVILQKLNCHVVWIDVSQLQLTQKQDCVDWLTKNPDASKKDIENLPVISPPLAKPVMETEKSAHPYFTVTDKGVFYYWNDNQYWICSKLEITALVRDNFSENWGRLLCFQDADGNLHQWSMPMAMLKGSGEELRGELLRLGLEIASRHKTRHLLLEYITTAKPEARARCVNRTGWHENIFVLPQGSIGEIQESMLFQSEHPVKLFQQRGTLQEWQQQVAVLCLGNSRLLLAVSSAFAAILLQVAGFESGGLHFVGESSTGKTTALRVAASVFGAPDYLHRWRATTNGIEALAALHSDTLLVLDELAQVDPREAGEIAYMLANGSGKTRANKSGSARSRYEWRLLFLSAGEVGLAQHICESGKKSKAGQEVRLVDIPADAEKNFGIFETLHEFETSALLSKALLDSTSQYYGTSAIAFLEIITRADKLIQLPNIIKKHCQKFIAENLPINAGGQIHRVCERFALIAVSGEIASHYKITGWPPGEAKQAAIVCFKAWLEQRGSIENKERTCILSQVRAFFEAHGESRFTHWNDLYSRTNNRAGFRKRENDTITYYVLPESFRNEICAGLDSRSVAKILIQEGWLKTDTTGSASRRECLPMIGRSRCFVFTNKMWDVG